MADKVTSMLVTDVGVSDGFGYFGQIFEFDSSRSSKFFEKNINFDEKMTAISEFSHQHLLKI